MALFQVDQPVQPDLVGYPHTVLAQRVGGDEIGIGDDEAGLDAGAG